MEPNIQVEAESVRKLLVNFLVCWVEEAEVIRTGLVTGREEQ